VAERSTLTTILDSMNEAVYEVDMAGNITRVNRGACRLLNRHPADILGKRVFDVFRWEDAGGRLLDSDEYLYRETVASGKDMQVSDRFLRGPDGRRVPVSVSSAPILGARGRPVAAVQVVRDITREREAQTLKDQIISLVSHELRTPLGHIKGFASSLLDPEVQWDEKTQKDFITEIDQEADRLSALGQRPAGHVQDRGGRRRVTGEGSGAACRPRSPGAGVCVQGHVGPCSHQHGIRGPSGDLCRRPAD
jgi:PAS domain S-box-containing protein